MQTPMPRPDAVDLAFDQRAEEALAAYARKQEAFQLELRAFTAWQMDDDGASLSFSGPSRRCTLRAAPVGTYMPGIEQWAWAWANDAFPEPLRQQAARLQDLSTKTGYGIFQCPFFRLRRDEIDTLCALALEELAGNAVFKIKDQEPWSFHVVG